MTYVTCVDLRHKHHLWQSLELSLAMLSAGVSPTIFSSCRGSTRSAVPQSRHVGCSRMLPRNWIAAGAGGLLGQFAQRCARMCQPSKTAKGSGTMQSVTQSKVLAVVGLGNVGNQYVGTRHNIGFAAVDEVASKLLDESGSWALEGPIWEAAHGGNLLRLKRQESNPPTESGFSELILFKPASMMNGSGLPVSQLMDALNLPETHLVLIYDDLDLEVGRLRLRKSGSAGGQNGVRSVLAQGFKDFLRMRLGISRPPKAAGRHGVVGHVLGRFRHEELEQTTEALQMAAAAIEDLAEGTSVDNVMNKFNRSLVTSG